MSTRAHSAVPPQTHGVERCVCCLRHRARPLSVRECGAPDEADLSAMLSLSDSVCATEVPVHVALLAAHVAGLVGYVGELQERIAALRTQEQPQTPAVEMRASVTAHGA